jgi:uncharacterized protein YgfB (UPF0149 family)
MHTTTNTNPILQINPLNDIIILANQRSDGTVFALHPQTKQKIQKDFPEISLFSQLFIGEEEKKLFKNVHASEWNQIVILLTGLSREKIKKKYSQSKIVVEYPKTKENLDLTHE